MSSGKEVGITDLLVEADIEILEVAAGLVSVPGPQGNKGDTGPAGPVGPAGRDGIDGLPGRDGVDGLPGRNGVDGLPGRDGRDGLDGLDGQRGPAGADGIDGKNGVDGKDGVQGLPGVAGSKGDKGDAGTNGRDGVDGAVGPAGATGAKGDVGATGPAGPSGAAGAKGDKGDTGATGAKGDAGTPGVAGADGQQGPIGPKGDAGSPGATGAKGDTGTAGAKGDTGAQGIQGVKGDTGATGATGAAGANGTNGTNGQGVPAGGTAGQVLSKSSATDYATAWTTPSSGSATNGLPTGGSSGQILTKTSATDYASAWQTKTLLTPAGTGREVQYRSSGTALAAASKVSVHTDGNLIFGGDAVVRGANIANRSHLSVSSQYALQTQFPLGVSPGFSTQREWLANGETLGVYTKAFDPAYQGTASAVAMAPTIQLCEPQITYETAAAANSIASLTCLNPVMKPTTTNVAGFFVSLRLRIPAWTAGQRWFVGLTDNPNAPVDQDPSAMTNFIGFGVNAADTNLQYMVRSTGTLTKTDINMPAAISGNLYTFMFFCPVDSSNITATVMSDIYSMGGSSTAVVGTKLYLKAWISTGSTTTKASIAFSRGYLEHIYYTF